MTAIPFEPGRSLVVGRGDDVDIQIDDASVSRRHAVFHFGPPLEVEDLGSKTGIVVTRAPKKGASAETADQARTKETRTTLEPGDTVYFGAALVVVREKKAAAPESADQIVRDPGMRKLYEEAARAAQMTLPILIVGETGVGKDVLARYVHERSPRAKKPLIALNCAALSETLAESELFGHEKGAFTGAQAQRAGLFESAHGGTLFLDEIGELPLATQAKLLRTLESSEVVRLGSAKPITVDVRFLSATNRDLERESALGKFRKDLYFRLNGITLRIPPLRARTSEIAELARKFLTAASAKAGFAEPPSITPEAMQALECYAWPGNVRELRWTMERALVTATSGTIAREHLPPQVADPGAASSPGRDQAATRDAVIEALARADGNQTKAAEMLGVSRRTLINRMIEYGLPRPRKG
jgi:DNA-binding NtrC family response regulator